MIVTDETREAYQRLILRGDMHEADAIRSLTAQLMESEFKRYHSALGYCGFCVGLLSVRGIDERERHNWTEEQWERAAEEELSK